ncbi:Sigma-70, region 4 [Sphingomonas sp. NFR04]|uniref:sigma factor-like helix-turn-helix DNA-binding protein n=1 Tax=Sphingomonas sp. NFR04 TaxID=1566283 RepID=UPI0008E6033C|nr:sigma factor-like helix-turn-helix DNA-binding protein [Sphingomonas sp. NFR04]SFJ50029.1 Sigma-70, region 4 [Sphingomonas sp. NFR04]
MSAPGALKAVSHRDSLAKTVRLLTRDGIAVQFRGHQPYVATKGNKALKLVLPELNDNASDELLAAIHGYLDHEVGHIFYTPFARATKAGRTAKAAALINIVEDIRLEKLLPRDLPGTKENLERMYEQFIPTMIHPAIEKALASGDAGQALGGVMVAAMRALAGQKAFQEHMDAHKLWPHFMPLLSRLPDLSRRLKAMETFDDVEEIVEAMLEAMKPPKREPKPEPEPEKGEEKAPPPPAPSSPDPADEDADDTSDDTSDEDADDTPDAEDASDDQGQNESAEDEGDAEGHGDGEGQSDGEDGDDADSCAGTGGDDEGDGSSDDHGEGESGEDDRDAADDDSEVSAGEADDGDADDQDEGDRPGSGKSGLSITDALKQLDPTERKALFLYKQRKMSVSEISKEMSKSESEVSGMLRNARRRLGQLMKGSRN